MQALPDRELEVLLSRRPEVVALAGRARPDWDELAANLGQPRFVARALTRLDRFLSQALQLACLAGGHLTAGAAAEEGLGRADLASAARELRRWGLAFADADGALAVPSEVARLVWNPGGLGTPATRLLEHLTVEELRGIAMRLGLSGAALPTRKAELVEAAGARLADRDAVRTILARAPAAARTELERLRRAGDRAGTPVSVVPGRTPTSGGRRAGRGATPAMARAGSSRTGSSYPRIPRARAWRCRPRSSAACAAASSRDGKFPLRRWSWRPCGMRRIRSSWSRRWTACSRPGTTRRRPR